MGAETKLRRRQTLSNATHLVGSPTDARLVRPVLKPKALLTQPETQDRCQRGSLGSEDTRKAGSGFPVAVLQPDQTGDIERVQRADFIHSFLDGGQDAPNMPQVTAPPHGILNGTQKGHRFSSSTQFPTTKYNLSNSCGVSLFPRPNPRGILMPYRPPFGVTPLQA